MSVENGKVCCNCRHNIREEDNDRHIHCRCEIDNTYLSYFTVMEGWCKHWATDEAYWQKRKEEEMQEVANKDAFYGEALND